MNILSHIFMHKHFRFCTVNVRILSHHGYYSFLLLMYSTSIICNKYDDVSNRYVYISGYKARKDRWIGVEHCTLYICAYLLYSMTVVRVRCGVFVVSFSFFSRTGRVGRVNGKPGGRKGRRVHTNETVVGQGVREVKKEEGWRIS